MSNTFVAQSTAPDYRQKFKCTNCNLVGFADADTTTCPRCEAKIFSDADFASLDDTHAQTDSDSTKREASLWRRALIILGVVAGVLVAAYASLIVTSKPLSGEQRQIVRRAIEVLRERGFTSEANMFSIVVSFRRTDSWWNAYTGHADAYAATNFPFQVVTLYPDFFKIPVDDTERAAVLLHEAQHLFGAGEPKAFNQTWRARKQLGWTADTHGETRVYRGTRELTRETAPEIFRCGLSSRTDCTEMKEVGARR